MDRETLKRRRVESDLATDRLIESQISEQHIVLSVRFLPKDIPLLFSKPELDSVSKYSETDSDLI